MTDDARLLLRFALGTAALARQEVVGAVRAGAQAPVAEDADAWLVPSARHVVIGALLDAPAALARLARTRPGVLATRLARRAAAPMARQLARWRVRGAAEEAAGIALARAAMTRLVDDAVGEVGATPSLEAIVQAQGVGLGQDALDRVRATTASADARIERLVRRVLRR